MDDGKCFNELPDFPSLPLIPLHEMLDVGVEVRRLGVQFSSESLDHKIVVTSEKIRLVRVGQVFDQRKGHA